MRSFLEFVSRCLAPPEVSRNEEVVAAEGTSTPRREETKSLMPPKVVALRKKKRVRITTPGSTTPEWKPSLYVISEDNVMAEKRERSQTEEEERAVVKRKSSSGSRSKVHVRSYSDDMGRNQVQMAIPTFSPAPFMF